jgi:gas vesicle protein
MKPRDMTEWFVDVLPFRRKSSIDWALPCMAGLGIGVAAGVGIGLLLAPRPGTETREKLRAGAENIKEKARSLADRAKGQLSNAGQQLGQGLQQSRSSEMHESR